MNLSCFIYTSRSLPYLDYTWQFYLPTITQHCTVWLSSYHMLQVNDVLYEPQYLTHCFLAILIYDNIVKLRSWSYLHVPSPQSPKPPGSQLQRSDRICSIYAFSTFIELDPWVSPGPGDSQFKLKKDQDHKPNKSYYYP